MPLTGEITENEASKMAEEKDMGNQEGRAERRIAAKKNDESVEARGTVRKAKSDQRWS